MPFSIQFVRGSLADRRWPAGPAPLLVGRSHACDIRPTESDVSGRHLQFVEAGDGIAVTVLSAHRTLVAGSRAAQGSVLIAPPGTVVELGDDLAFRVVDDEAAADETASLPEQATGTLPGATEGLATAATRFAGEDTGMLDETGTATAATRFGGEETGTFTAATRFGGDAGGETGTVTAATRFGGSADGDETSILGGAPTAAGETGESDLGETQVLQTQVASLEELEKIKTLYEQRRTKKVATKFGFLGFFLVLAIGLTVWISLQTPERRLELPTDRTKTQTVLLLPKLAPSGAVPVGNVGISFPKEGAEIPRNGDGVFDATIRIGRNYDVAVHITFEVFEDMNAPKESRSDSFDRYLENSEAMRVARGDMEALPEEDFFGGRRGLCRGIPCSRREYWCGRDGESVYGVVSFFRSGTLCCAFRREISSFERERAKHLLQPTSKWLYADRDGAFAAVQWEGRGNADEDADKADAVAYDPAAEIAQLEKRLRVDSTADWPMLEAGFCRVLAALSGPDGDATQRDRARGHLAELRAAKAMHWRKLAARRNPFLSSGGKVSPEAAAIDAIVRKDFSDPAEEWYFLARRREWWK